MKTTDPRILNEFTSVLNRKHLTEEVFQKLLYLWSLDKVDLDAEMDKINKKCSNLSKSRREALPYFLKLRTILEEKKKAENASMNLTNDQPKNVVSDTFIA